MSSQIQDSRYDPNDLRVLFVEGARHMGLSLDRKAIDNLLIYCRELRKWNSTINLVAAAPIRDIIDLHFFDSLALLPLLQSFCPWSSLLDIGSGAGFPGLALKAAVPDWPMTLVEPRQKRVVFLRHVVRSLGVSGIEIHEQHLTPDSAAQRRDIGVFPILTGRAVSDLRVFLRLASNFCQTGGHVFCMKGKKADEEIHHWHQDISSPMQLAARHPYTLPFSRARREIIVFRKD